MKYLIMTEGTCEKALLNVLLEKKMLKLTESDLLYEKVHHKRRLDLELISMINQLPPEETVSIIRIGDKLRNENLRLSKEIKTRISEVKDYCLTPEFEITYIIFYRKYEDFLKEKSKMKASEYLKRIDKAYRKTYECNFQFFSKLKNSEIKKIFSDYNILRAKTHRPSQKLISELLKN